jgi:molybdopterin-guanine dinucleotide biosynthesis protein A
MGDESSQLDVSGIVLAGGMSRRLGRDKAVELVEGEPLISCVISRVAQVSDEVVVVVGDRNRAAALPLPVRARPAVDIFPGKASLGGIFTGLTAARAHWGLVVACDMPFLNTALLRHMLSLRAGYDAVVPVVHGRPEPTHALYSKACLPQMERMLQGGDLRIARLFDEVRVRYLSQEKLERLDPHHESFFNINTQENLDRALALVARSRPARVEADG